MRMTQRLTAFMLALLLLITMLPTAAFAESNEANTVPAVNDIPIFQEEAPLDVPTAAATEAPAETSTEVPAAETPQTETPAPEAPATDVPVTELPATEASTATPAPEAPAFAAGLATLASGAKLYEDHRLQGEYKMTAARGTVYASAISDDESAILVALNTSDGVLNLWVRASQVKLLTQDAAAAYERQAAHADDARDYQGHPLLMIPLEGDASIPAPTDVPVREDSFGADLAITLPSHPLLTAPPSEEVVLLTTPAPTATGTPNVSDVPVVLPDPTRNPDTGRDESVDDDFIFTEDVSPAPEPTEVPLPNDLIIPDAELPDIGHISAARTLESPSGISAYHTHDGILTLNWNGTADADAYLLQYKAPGQADYSILTITDKTTYTTASLGRTSVYYFRVTAVELDVAGEIINQSAPSGSFPYIILGDVKIEDPRGKDSSTIRLVWKSVSGANRYDVMMSVHGANDWHIVRTDLKTYYCDIKDLSFNETYDFRVIPKRLLDNGEVITGNPSYVPMVGSPMETPSFIDYEWTSTGAKLTWDAIPGATGYVIYRRSFNEPPSAYKKLVVIDEPVTSYVDTTMSPSLVYYYFVYSFRNCQPEGWRCFSLKGDIGMGIWLPATTGLAGQSLATGGTRLTWDQTTGANYYDVHISAAQGAIPTAIGRVSRNSGSHSNAVLGKPYYYRIRPVRVFSNGDVSLGPWSVEYTYTRQQAEPVEPTYRALLIGNTYPGEEKYLPGCDNDVNGMATMLSRMTGTPYTVSKRFNLTDDGIVSAIKSAFAGATSDDISLFYYSGHGASSVDSPNYHGSLVGVYNTFLSINRLREALDTIPGRKVVILDSCHSGNVIGKGTKGLTAVSRSTLNEFNSQVVSAFASGISRSAAYEEPADENAAPIFVEDIEGIVRTEQYNNLATNGYYVITAAHSTEESISGGYDPDGDGKIDKYFGLFTYGLCYGSGWNMGTNSGISTLYADFNSNLEISLYEAYYYAKLAAQKTNPGQTAQIYPDNSGLVVWAK